VREARQSFLAMHTAPTEHTPLLLDSTGAHQRSVTRRVSGSGLHITTPTKQLQDPTQPQVLNVTLPQPTPFLDPPGRQADLPRAGIEPWAWVINRSLAVASTTSPLLQRRAANERACIEAVTTRHASRCAVVGLQPIEPIGAERLAALVERHPSAVAG